jgi:hypothetical protein
MSADGQGRNHWFDDEAGPVVRPYAMTRGRTTSAGQHRLDLIAVVVMEPGVEDPETDPTLAPEHVEIVGLCRDTPQSLAELAAELGISRERVRQLQNEAEQLLKFGTRRVVRRTAGRPLDLREEVSA